MERDRELRDASLGELFQRLSGEMVLLVRQELDLFRVEMTEKTKDVGGRVAGGAVTLSAAAICGLAAVGALTATIILLLALVMPAWAAALIVTALYGFAAAIMALRGKQQLEDVKAPVPNQTIETVKEDVEWAKTRANSAKR
jgi:uncharacterized membrane protein YqjE